MASITLSTTYQETNAFGSNLEFVSLSVDAKAQSVCVMLEMKDASGWRGKMVCISALPTGGKVSKLNGDVQDVPSLTYAALEAKVTAGGVAEVLSFISSQVTSFASGA